MKMKSRQPHRIGRLAVALTLTTSLSMLASAQERPADKEAKHKGEAVTVLETVTITAQKKKELLQDVPVSIKVLGADTLEKTNADGLDNIAQQVPSMSMTNLARGGNQVQIRGLGSNVASVGTVAIYNDGVISPSRIQSSGTFAEQDSVLFDVDRVEVLRGPQGTLYGEGSFGGVINIISKRPSLSEVEASASVSTFNTKGGGSGNSDVRAMLNVPVKENVLAVRAVGFQVKHDGYIDAVNVLPVLLGQAPVLVKANANTEDVSGGRILMTLNPGSGFDATAIVKSETTKLGVHSTISPHLIGLVNRLTGSTFNPESAQGMFGPNIGSDSKVDQGILELNVRTPLGPLTAVTGVGEVKQNAASTLKADSKSRNAEIRLNVESDGPLTGTVGTYYRHASRNVVFAGAPALDNVLEQKSVFGQAYWKFAPRLTATMGLRYEEQDIDVTDQLNHLPPVHGSFSSVIPKLAVDFKADENSLYYASVGKGFRAGGANADQSLGTDPNYLAAFKPDHIWNYETGMKRSFLNRILTVNATLFYIDWSDIQIDRAINSILPGTDTTQFIVVNGKKAHSYGIEIDTYFRPTRDWDIVLGGSFLRAKFRDGTIDSSTLGPNIPLSGMTLPSTPNYQLNASVERRFTVGGVNAFVRGDYSRRGSSFGDVPNTPPPGGNLSSGMSQSLNLRVGVRQSQWELQAYATNVTNEHDSTYSYYDGRFADVNALLRPRTIGLNLKLYYN